MKILKDERAQTGWITAIIDGRWVQAKVYDEPSEFGVNNGRVSKLAIGNTDHIRRGAPFFSQLAYNYDRGLDMDDLPAGALDSIVAQLESLPAAL